MISGWRDAIADAPDELTTMINLTAAPPLPFLPEAVHGGRVAVVIACYAGDIDKGEAAVAALRSLGDPIADCWRPCPTSRCSSCSIRCGKPEQRTISPPCSWMDSRRQPSDTLVEAHGRSAPAADEM